MPQFITKHMQEMLDVALALEKRDMGIMAVELSQHGTLRALERRGLLKDVGWSHHEDGDKEGRGYRLTPKGRKLAKV